MIRLDYEVAAAVDESIGRRLVDAFTRAVVDADVVLLEDYNKGVLSPAVCNKIIRTARDAGNEVLIDPAAINDYSKYAGATCLKLNRTETEKATGIAARSGGCCVGDPPATAPPQEGMSLLRIVQLWG